MAPSPTDFAFPCRTAGSRGLLRCRDGGNWYDAGRFAAVYASGLRNNSMAWKTLVSDRADWLRDTNAMLVSACCHFAMLIAVALVSVVGSRCGDGTQIVVSLGKGADSTIVDDSPLEGVG